MVKGPLLTLRLEDKGSNELFAACPIEQFPGMSVEPVTDSSRYFVICIKVKSFSTLINPVKLFTPWDKFPNTC
jgi:hypothetical protein